MNKSKLWTKNFITIALANLFVALSFYLLMTTMAVFAIEQFHASESKAGLAASIFIIGALLSRLFAGKYIEVVGRRNMLFGSLLLFFIATLLYFPVASLNLLLLVRFIHGVAFGVANTALSTIAMDMIPNDRRGEGTGYYSLSATGATAVGPFLGLFISQHAAPKMIFVACTLFTVVSIFILLFTKIPQATITMAQLEEMKRGFKLQDFFERKALPISIVMIFMGIAYSGIVSFINSYAIDIDLVESGSLFFIIYAVFLFLSRPFTGRLLDAKGDNIVIYPALIIFSLSLLLLSQVHHAFVFLLCGALIALGFGTMMSSAQAIAIKLSPKHRVGLATSTFFICLDGGMGIGPFLIGMIVPHVGYRGMYIALAILVFLSIYLYYFLHGKKGTIAQQQSPAAS
ncbi:MFS transporter [Caldibacillus lycopersici]|uniref:MFS transporter n=1 Tax=Perspicuibacillus lycopersici TaxID=1325689 RepID=A0AAE3IWZ0_9BACI|nr:MFS transporter [Perspicuibacillus lycopersici]MCU9614429.1 MFS transporter [Perspicuibacillus lycopersici]